MTTLIVTAAPIPGQDEARGRYLQGVLPILIGAGGKPVKRLRVTDTVMGTAGIGIALVMDFDSAEAITGLFETDEYLALTTDRDQAFTNMEILVAEDIG